MNDIKYFLLKAADVPACKQDSDPRHKQASGGCELSITWNVAGTQALVKIVGADSQWLADKPWALNALKVYDDNNKYDRFTDLNFYSEVWQPKEQ